MLLLTLSSLALAQETTPIVPDLPGTIVAPIINGDDADADDWPSAGGMILDAYLDLGNFGAGKIRLFVCSSTLIAPDVVLLAAHCLDDEALTQGLGTISDKDIRWTRQSDLSDYDGSRSQPSWPDDAVVAWDWVMHPDFDPRSLGTGLAENDDIALIFLDEPVTDVPHAYVVTADETDEVVEGAEVVVVGWGQQEATSSPLQAPPEGTYAYKQQGDSVIGAAGTHEFQVGVAEDDVRKCHGDSGGPTYLAVADDGRYEETWRVVGVTSHAYDRSDCDNTGGVDTRVSAYLDWIDQELHARCEDGTRSWCEVEGIVPPPEAVQRGDTGDSDAGAGEGPLGGCGCAAAPAPTRVGWALGLLGLVGLRRRR